MHNYSLGYFNLLLLFYLLLSKGCLWCVLKWVSLGLSCFEFAQLFQCASLCLCPIWEVFSHYAFKYSFSIFQIPIFFFSLGDFGDTVGSFALFHSSLRPWSFYFFSVVPSGWILLLLFFSQGHWFSSEWCLLLLSILTICFFLLTLLC